MERKIIYGFYNKPTSSYYGYFTTEEGILRYMKNYIDNKNTFLNGKTIVDKNNNVIFTIHPICLSE